jgi:hypothetical protein
MPKDGTEVDSDESVKSASGQNDGPDQDHASAEGVKSGLAQKDGPKA